MLQTFWLVISSVHVHCSCSGTHRKIPVFANSWKNHLGKMEFVIGFSNKLICEEFNIRTKVYLSALSKRKVEDGGHLPPRTEEGLPIFLNL